MTDNIDNTTGAGDGNASDQTQKYSSGESNLLDKLDALQAKYAANVDQAGLQFPDTKGQVVKEFVDEVRALYQKQEGLLGVLEGNGLSEIDTHFIGTLDQLASRNPEFAVAAYGSLNQAYGVGSLAVVDAWVEGALKLEGYDIKKSKLEELQNQYDVDLKTIDDLKEARLENLAGLSKEDTELLTSLEASLEETSPLIAQKTNDLSDIQEKVVDYLRLGPDGQKAYVDLRLDHVQSQRRKIAYGTLAKIVAGVAIVAGLGLGIATYKLDQKADDAHAVAVENKGLYEDSQKVLDGTRRDLDNSEAEVDGLTGQLETTNAAKETLEGKLEVCNDDAKRMTTLPDGSEISVEGLVEDHTKCNDNYNALDKKHDALKERCAKQKTRRSPRVRKQQRPQSGWLPF
ncbi:hypothetical protein HQ489_03105 [Candidatus Woesearchaeota archaeon]|nr:hypothetical protein [Candidatus Woesearchaeota archaeon]